MAWHSISKEQRRRMVFSSNKRFGTKTDKSDLYILVFRPSSITMVTLLLSLRFCATTLLVCFLFHLFIQPIPTFVGHTPSLSTAHQEAQRTHLRTGLFFTRGGTGFSAFLILRGLPCHGLGAIFDAAF